MQNNLKKFLSVYCEIGYMKVISRNILVGPDFEPKVHFCSLLEYSLYSLYI